MHTFEQFLFVTLYFLTRFTGRATPRQLARLCGMEQAEVDRHLARLDEENLIDFGRFPAPPPIEFFNGPIFRSKRHGKVSFVERIEFLTHINSDNASDTPGHKSMNMASATAKGCDLVGGYFPPYFVGPDHDLGRMLNVAAIIVDAHIESLYRSRPEEMTRAPIAEGEPKPLVAAPFAAPAEAPLTTTARLDRSPFLERPQTAPPRPDRIVAGSGYPRSAGGTYDLMNSFHKQGNLWVGEGVLRVCGLSVGGVIPDLAVVVKGKIQHAAMLMIGKELKELIAFAEACREADVSFELYAHPPKEKK